MCGIVGCFGSNLITEEELATSLSSIIHRGRDDQGNIRKNNFILGHNRLSIMDVAGGHQPLYDRESQLYAIANGEIYNYPQWREQLQETYHFSTHSDTEIILPLYQQFSYELPRKLDGMFSFILGNEQEFLVARDRLGIKPLYYIEDSTNLIFASEIKALIPWKQEIKEFPNGYYYHSTQGLQSYYSFPEPDHFITDIDTILHKIRQGLSASIRKRLMSDVPVGVFLSGGLDSSIIAALMKQNVEHLHSFSVGFANAPDLKAARLVAEHLGTIHHEYIYSEAEVLSFLPEVIYHLESFNASLIRSAVPCYIVSRLASQYVKVILTGEGADELFAGYSYLANYNDGKILQEELIALIQGLHNLNLQRVDRMTMAHGVEGRVPFLDTDFVEMAMTIEPSLKLYQRFGIEKWLLRKAFANDLPSEVLWRDKMEFAHGCASSTFLDNYANKTISDEDFTEVRCRGEPISSKEELLYYRVFQKYFPSPHATNLVGMWNKTLH
ncbi:asparagine synthase B [Spirulina sp. CS-785/01]|uniref:asparagine synthase B n=1 Tax=Spirulina sp. CS-785/01 TaxID=3021716 RepID=UPI002331402B|nr:asparagine synthase B [Spirulina sp. CS-785/01]MDB9314637.1 asparagine synthase B [Spirulina sp. CS-785/01]